MANRKKRLEREHKRQAREEKLKSALQQYKKKKNINLIIATVMNHWNGKLNPKWKQVKRNFKLHNYLQSHDIQLLEKLLKTDRAVILQQALTHRKLQYMRLPFFIALLKMLLKSPRVFLDLTSWKPTKSTNEELIFINLFKHVFVGYKINKSVLRLISIDRVCNQIPLMDINLTLDLAAGKGLHRLDYLKCGVSKKMNFYFENAPEKLDTYHAMVWAKAKALGASSNLAILLACNYADPYAWVWKEWMSEFIFFVLKEEIEDYKFLKSILLFFDYQINFKAKFVRIKAVKYRVPILFPDFSFKGRTLNSVMRMMKAWDEHVVNVEKNASFSDFPASGLNEFRTTTRSGKIIYIKELKNGIELVKEGSVMKHCVGLYLQECTSGSSSIWSLRMISKDTGRIKRLATIEIEKRTKGIFFGEVQGKANTCPPQFVIDILKKWGMENEVKNAEKWTY